MGSIRADLVNLSATRSVVAKWLTGRVNQQEIDDIVLVFNELLANAINQSASYSGQTMNGLRREPHPNFIDGYLVQNVTGPICCDDVTGAS